MRLPFSATLTDDTFQHKIDELLKKLPNVFDLAYDILNVCYDADGKDIDRMLRKVIKIYHNEKLK